MSGEIHNTSDLRKMLLETIDQVRKGKLDHKQATSIGNLSSQILRSARLDFDVMRLQQSGLVSPKAPASVSLLPPKGKGGRPRLTQAA